MRVSAVDAMFGRPGWSENFHARVARRSPSIPATLLEVPVLEPRANDV